MNDGYKIPALGLGVFRVPPGNSTYASVRSALELGYRMVDTAAMYMNEADVGRACRDSGIPRSELFISTKLWETEHGFRRALAAGRKSNAQLGLGYIDLYLIHSPGALTGFLGGGKIVETYDALLQLRKEGVVRSVGVSNFGISHLEALHAHGRPAPAVNQFEIHPMVYQERASLVEYCRKNKILVQAYGSVLSGHQQLMDKTVSAAAGHGKTAAQVLLRWALDQGFVVIPKSTHLLRQAENMDLFDFSLSKQEIVNLNSANPAGRLKWDYWDPLQVKVSTGDLSYGHSMI